MALLIGLDIGTSKIKVALFNEQGDLLAISNQESPLYMDGGCVEHDAETCWGLIVRGVREVIGSQSAPASEIAAISLSSQGQTFLPVDSRGRPLSRAIVWLDQRAAVERLAILDQFGSEEIYRHTGLTDLTPGNVSSLLLWLRKQRPEVFHTADRFLHISDYIVYKLTRRMIAEVPIYSCMGIYDLATQGWWTRMLDFINLTPRQLPELVPAGEMVGNLSSEAAGELGLSLRTAVISGTLDVSAAVLGSNTLSPYRLAVSLGTTLQTNLTMKQFHVTPGRLDVWIFSHVIPGEYVGVLWRETAGFTLRWFRDVFCQEEIERAKLAGCDEFDLMTEQAAQVAPGSEGLLILPHLQGTHLPESYPEFRGIAFGISASHKKAHFIRAILEGVGYSLLENIEIYASLGFPIQELWATGGGAKSSLWNQINADITGRPQYQLRCPEAATLGAAILAALGVGLYGSLVEACQWMVKPIGVILPNPDNRSVYADGYALYRKIFQHNKKLFVKKR